MNKSLLLLTSMLCTSLALAEPPDAPSAHASKTTDQARTEALVHEKVVQRLKKSFAKRKAFSRVAPPKEQRVRVIDRELQKDARGAGFARFSVESRYLWDEGKAWHVSYQGCAYPDDGRVYLQRGEEDTFVPALSLEQPTAKAQGVVCRPAPQDDSLALAD